MDSGVQGYDQEDPLGSVLATRNGSGNDVSRQSTDAYGIETTLMAGPRSDHRWAGRHGYVRDDEAGMVMMGARYYVPALGRFLTQDPIGQEGGLNLYAYCNNSPLVRLDPSGKQGFTIGVFQFDRSTVGNGLLTGWESLKESFSFGYYQSDFARGQIGFRESRLFGDVGREALITAATLGLGETVQSYRAFDAARRAGGTVELYHYTTMEASGAIMSSGFIKGTARGLWGNGVTYFGSTLRANWFTRTILRGLSPSHQEAFVAVQAPIKDVAWRPLGIRFVKSMGFRF